MRFEWYFIDTTKEERRAESVSAHLYLPLSLFSYLLVISGSVTLLLGFFGSIGALKEVKCMLATYFILLTVLLAAQIIGTVLLFTQRSVNCKQMIKNWLDAHIMIILGVVLALAVAEICGTILSMFLYNQASMV
ncbi:hypothetical protein QTP86_013620 [Hemibagrus guttatus]|nr:hypothetical protein QTP86_013620 [Hemibagrus guttatus]